MPAKQLSDSFPRIWKRLIRVRKIFDQEKTVNAKPKCVRWALIPNRAFEQITWIPTPRSLAYSPIFVVQVLTKRRRRGRTELCRQTKEPTQPSKKYQLSFTRKVTGKV